MFFPVSGVETPAAVPVAAAFVISFFASMGGSTAAVLLLPFMVSVLGYAGPGASATSLLYNTVAAPAGVIAYGRERRVCKPLAWAMAAALLPGQGVGVYARVRAFAAPERFRLLLGLVLLAVGLLLLRDVLARASGEPTESAGREIEGAKWTAREVSFDFGGKRYEAPTWALGAVSFATGFAGGAYGIAGGALLAPLLVAMFRFPVYVVAGTVLLVNAVVSLIGVAAYQAAAWWGGYSGAAPDVSLGLLFGLGGVPGVYLGAWCQRYVRSIWIKAGLALLLFFLAAAHLANTWPR